MNQLLNRTPELIQKEQVSALAFPKEEVITDMVLRDDLRRRMKKALKLGNNLKRKVKIIFEDEQGLKKVETTIWGVTEKNILLKQTTLIPIRRIHEIKFY